MLKNIDILKILEKNPHISKEELDRAISSFDNLQNTGLQPRGYRLDPPSMRRKTCFDEDETDPRTIKLTYSRKYGKA